MLIKHIEATNLKPILSLLFFEQGFLSNHARYQAEIFSMYSREGCLSCFFYLTSKSPNFLDFYNIIL